MQRLFSLFSVLAFTSVAVAAEPSVTLPLWPGTAPGEKGNIPPETLQPPKANEDPPIKRLTNVSQPTLSVYKPPAERNTGAAVLIAPGGGYNILAISHEGEDVAAWLNSFGVTGIVLKYRVPRRPDQPKNEPPLGALQDAQRALGLIRQNAKEWGIDPNRVGMLGFSAGGHLTAWTLTNYDQRSYPTVDEADQHSCRPDFGILIYPAYLVNAEEPTQLNSQLPVTKQTPPCFFVHAFDDRVSPENSLRMALALKAAGVPTEVHIYSSGGHGFGMRTSDKPVASWPKRCEEWLREQGWLKARKS